MLELGLGVVKHPESLATKPNNEIDDINRMIFQSEIALQMDGIIEFRRKSLDIMI